MPMQRRRDSLLLKGGGMGWGSTVTLPMSAA
jgi:hypothetical protein